MGAEAKWDRSEGLDMSKTIIWPGEHFLKNIDGTEPINEVSHFGPREDGTWGLLYIVKSTGCGSCRGNGELCGQCGDGCCGK